MYIISHFCGGIIIIFERLQNLGFCSALRAFELGEIFIVPHQLCHWKDCSIQLPLGRKKICAWRVYLNLAPHGAYNHIFQRIL
jgi:hypothetical protein